jgi:NAD(P)H-hydrate epimerase
MIVVLSRDQMRAYDKYAVDTCHVPGVVLMENAGRGAADVISAMIEAKRPTVDHEADRGKSAAQREARAARERAFPVRHVRAPGQPARYPLDARIVVVCGTGNNGGDGFVVARHLWARGADVAVFLVGRSEKVTGDARINLDSYIDLGGAFTELPAGAELAPLEAALAGADYVVDALFGTGLDRPIAGHLAAVIELVNASPAHCVALDVPSGLDANSGSPLGGSVEADDTVTFGHLKIGLLTPEGARLAGDIHVVDLGMPDGPILGHVGHVAEVIRPETVGADLVPRAAGVHKHQAGNVGVVAGSAGKIGAAWLAAHAALRAGAGLVTVCTWPDSATALEARAVEVMTARIDPARIERSLDEALKAKRAVAIGPGLGLDLGARRVVEHVVLGWDGVKVVDADAITLLADRPDSLRSAKGEVVLTPHPGELGRLLGRSAKEVEADRFGAVRAGVEKTGAIVVLKGARTIIAAPSGHMSICMAGNPALATAGSGDVLTGIIAAFACSLPLERAAVAGVYVHALAGDLWRQRTGADRGLLAGEIAELVPTLIARLGRGEELLAV